MADAAILNFKKFSLGLPWPMYGEYLSANQIWCKYAQKLLRYLCSCISVRDLPQFWRVLGVPPDELNFYC